MIIHNIQECEQWVNRRGWYPLLEKVLLFEPKIEKKQFFSWHVVDICNKSFQHDLNRIEQDINKICENYLKLKPIVDKLHIFMSPKPSVDTANAIASNDYICYFARATQIPWCMTDYITTHELGHIVEDCLCQRRISNKFTEYLKLRNAEKGICSIYVKWDEENEKNIYEDKEDFLYLNGTHEQKEKYKEWDMNPAEWFAEDFRYLFGVDQGDKFWGHPIPKPDERIKEFFLSL